jgi:hypothetical protein
MVRRASGAVAVFDTAPANPPAIRSLMLSRASELSALAKEGAGDDADVLAAEWGGPRPRPLPTLSGPVRAPHTSSDCGVGAPLLTSFPHLARCA